jgi:hypothetical protein
MLGSLRGKGRWGSSSSTVAIVSVLGVEFGRTLASVLCLDMFMLVANIQSLIAILLL